MHNVFLLSISMFFCLWRGPRAPRPAAAAARAGAARRPRGESASRGEDMRALRSINSSSIRGACAQSTEQLPHQLRLS